MSWGSPRGYGNQGYYPPQKQQPYYPPPQQQPYYQPQQPNYGGRSNYRQQRPVKKHSGCKWVVDKKLPERPTMIGWNYSKRLGLISFIACEVANSQDFKSNNPKNKDYKKWVVTVNFAAQGKKTFNGLFRISTQKLYIPDLNMVANPAAQNGGYWGQSGKPKNR